MLKSDVLAASRTARSGQVRSVTLIDPVDDGHHLSYALQLAAGLNARGVRVHLVGTQRFIEHMRAHADIDRSHAVFLFEGDPDKYWNSGVVNIERSNLRFVNAAMRAAREFESDVAHFVFVDRFLLSLLGERRSFDRIRVCATLHWAFFLDPFRQGRLSRIKGRLWLWALRRSLAGGMRLMIHSPDLARALRQKTGSNRVDYVPYPVEVPPLEDAKTAGQRLRERLGLSATDKLLLAFGTVRHDKGVDLAIEALGALPDAYHLLIAGPPVHFQEADIARFAARHGVAQRVHTELGFVPEAEVGAYFAASDVVLIPYRRDFAGQSGPLTIAAALGRPIAASDVGVLRETVEAYGLGELFEAENIPGMARAIQAAAQNWAGSPNQRFLQDHTPARFAQTVFESYLGEGVVP